MTEEIQPVQKPSMKRQVAATSISVGVGIALSIGANALIGIATKKIHNKILPPESEETNTEE